MKDIMSEMLEGAYALNNENPNKYLEYIKNYVNDEINSKEVPNSEYMIYERKRGENRNKLR